MREFFEHMTGNGWLAAFLISMVPVAELRLAIPVGVSMGLSHLQALCVSVIGNMVPVPFIIVFIRRVFAFLRRHAPFLERAVRSLEKKAESKRAYIYKWQLFGLMLLVAVPLPGTGAWTGALVAALMDIRLSRALPAILLGVLAAGIIVTGITFGFSNFFA